MLVHLNTNQIMNFPPLNLPFSELKIIKKNTDKYEIYDIVRKKFVALTPEEWVRQNFVNYLVEHKKLAISRLKLEHTLKIHESNKRCDIVYFDKKLSPILIVECKTPLKDLNKSAFNQIAMYNSILTVKYMIVTNGIKHFAAEIDYKKKQYNYLDIIPDIN